MPLIAARLLRAQALEVSLRTVPARLLCHPAALAALSQTAALEVVIPAEHFPDPGPDRLRNSADRLDDVPDYPPKAPDPLRAALDRLAAEGARLSLTLDFTPVLADAELSDRVVRRLDSLARLQEERPNLPVSLAVSPDARNLSAALALAAAAASAGLRRVNFSHPDLIGRPPSRVRPRLITADALARLSATRLSSNPPAAAPPGLLAPVPGELVIHDLFLREALSHPAAGYAGCQAGSVMAHVDARGTVYPCSALPVRLGNLSEADFAALWSSPAADQIRAKLAACGPVCAACPRLPVCRGGCRGLSRFAFGTWGKPDPACPRL